MRFSIVMSCLFAGAAVAGTRTATDAMAESYSPPILANGDIGLLIDYRNCQFQDVPSYKSIHAVGEKYYPGIYRAGRRTENGKLAAFGRIEEHVSLTGADDAKPVKWSQTLDISNALSVCENEYAGGARVDSTAFVVQGTSVIAIEKRFAGEVARYSFDYVFRRPGTDARLPLNTTATFKPGEIAFSVDREKDAIDGTISVLSDSPAVRAETIEKGVRLTLEKPRGNVRFFIVYRDSLDKAKPDVASVRTVGWDGLLDAHRKAWRAFWGDTYISIPDARVQDTYYTALYNLKCWSTAWSIPVGILPTHWHGAFFGFTFFNPALCASGHVPEAVKVARFWGNPQHLRSAHFRAGNVKRNPDCGLRYNWQTLEDFSENAKKGRWLDHYLHLGNISLECWTAWRYTGDEKLLRETVYPVVKGCAQYFQTHLVCELKDGRTVLGPLCDLERLPCPVRNAFLTTCGALYCLERAAEGADILGADRDEAAEWRRLAAALRRAAPFPPTIRSSGRRSRTSRRTGFRSGTCIRSARASARGMRRGSPGRRRVWATGRARTATSAARRRAWARSRRSSRSTNPRTGAARGARRRRARSCRSSTRCSSRATATRRSWRRPCRPPGRISRSACAPPAERPLRRCSRTAHA